MKKICLILILGYFFFFNPQKLFAANGGIYIGDKFSEFDQAVQTVGQNGWITVMMTPGQAKDNLDRFIKSHSNIVVRGHYPGVSLTSQYANEWAQTLSQIDGLVNYQRTIYFMPVNEPNFIDEGPIPAQTVIDYVNALSGALSSKNLLHTKVKLLSPGLNLYTLSDEGPSYVDSLGGWNFFNQFDGITLHLYGEFNASEINQSAAPIKRGVYKDFLKSHFKVPDSEVNNVKIFAPETGVKKVGDRVKYQENANEIKTYFQLLKPQWDSNPNFIMFSIFSYDPSDYNRPSWIYSEPAVIQSMGLVGGGGTTVQPTNTPTPAASNDFQREYEIFKNANKRLLPKSRIDEMEREQADCVGGFKIPIINVCLGGKTAQLVRETEQFQPIFVSKEKVVSARRDCGILGCTIENLFEKIVPPQIEEKETGSLNTFRPKNLEFSDVNKNNSLGAATESSVLAAVDSPETRFKDSTNFTLKILLPKSLGDKFLNPTAQPPLPTATPFPTQQPTSTPNPSPPPPPPPSDNTALTDPFGSNALKNLMTEVGEHFKVPPAVIAPVSWIEGSNVWRYTDSQIIEYSREGARDPFWTIPLVNICRQNRWTAAGPMQFTAGQWSVYKYSVRQSPGESARNPIVCNIKDPFWAAGRKLKVDSLTGNSTSMVWNKQAVANAGWRYYGACGACDANGDPELSKGQRDNFACNRLGMTYCEYMWKYYQCNQTSVNVSEFSACSLREGLNRIRF